MTTAVPLAILQLRAACERGLADPGIATSASRARRLRRSAALLERAAADLPAEVLRDVDALLAPDVIGHPDQPDSILGRACAGQWRVRLPAAARGSKDVRVPFTIASQRDLMDGIADLARAAGLPQYPWQQWGQRLPAPRARIPLDFTGHTVLRRALSVPTTSDREPYRLRILAAVELVWATGVPPAGLVASGLDDLTPGMDSIRLTINLPGRGDATRSTFPLDDNARSAIRQWLPVRDDVVTQYLVAGTAAQSNRALFITLQTATGIYDDGTPRRIPPGVRIQADGLELEWTKWARRLNAENQGGAGWPVPTNLQQLYRGGAAHVAAMAAGAVTLPED